MHGLINRTLQCFLRDSYGGERWAEVVQRSELEIVEFEAMMIYEEEVTFRLLDSISQVLGKSREEVLEDVGTYLVSHPNAEALRRLLRFGGVTFAEFLHSLDDLPERARLAVSDLDLPRLELRDHAVDFFSLSCQSSVPGYGHVIVGLLRAMADDYGALVCLEHKGRNGDTEIVEIQVVESAFADGREFDLGARRA